MTTAKKYWQAFKNSALMFFQDNGLKLSASLSFYTLFAIGPALLIVLSILGFLFGRDAVQGQIFGEIATLVGADTAKQIEEVIKNIELSKEKFIGLITGTVVLFIGATAVFVEMQDSINYIWSVKSKPKKGFIKIILNRVLSFSLLLSFGFILLVSLVLNSGLEAISNRLLRLFPDALIAIAYIINMVVTFGVITLVFAFIFKLLPDAKLRWKDVWHGALITAILFMIGKFGIGFYVSRAKIITAYGTATSVIILLSWVYYSAAILFFGAAYTRNRAIIFGNGIKLKNDAVFIVHTETTEWEATDKSYAQHEKKKLIESA